MTRDLRRKSRGSRQPGGGTTGEPARAKAVRGKAPEATDTPSPVATLARARLLGHDVSRLSLPGGARADGPRPRQPLHVRPSVDDHSIRRNLVAQISPEAGDEGDGGPWIRDLNIVGRPERVFGSTMGDHTTAFAVHQSSLGRELRGANAAEGFDILRRAYLRATELPGYGLKDQLPEDGSEKVLGRRDSHRQRLEDSEVTLRNLLEGEQDQANLERLQRAVSAYLEFRELIPLSAVNVKAKSPALAGKGKGEASHVKTMAEHQEGTSKLDPDQRMEAIRGVFDLGSSALAAVEMDGEMLGRMLPGLAPAKSLEERIDLLVGQHVASLKDSFPALFGEDLKEQRVAELLSEDLKTEMRDWMVATARDLKRHDEEYAAQRGREEDNLWEAKGRGHKGDIRRAEASLRRIGEMRKEKADRLARLEESYLRFFAAELPAEEMEIDEPEVEALPTGREPAKKKRKTDEKPAEPTGEAAEGAVPAPTEDELLAEEERNAPLATQVVLGDDGIIRELVSAGRSPSPFSGTMGAHTTAWVVHVDRVRRELVGKSVADATEALENILVAEAKAMCNRRLESDYFDQPEGLEQAETRLDDFPKRMAETPESLRALMLQDYVNAFLTYVNYIPGATLDKADTGAKREGHYRKTLREFQEGQSQYLELLRGAIQGLLDIGGVAPGPAALLEADHEELVRATYPDAAAAVFDGEDAPDEVKGRLLEASLESPPGKRKRSSIEEEEFTVTDLDSYDSEEEANFPY